MISSNPHKILIFLYFFQVKASDRDSGYDGEVMYVISNGDDDSVFEVRSNSPKVRNIAV